MMALKISPKLKSMIKNNKTIEKFLKPHTFLKEYRYWYLTLRENQLTYGAMVLLEKSEKTMFSEIDEMAFLELKLIFSEVEEIFCTQLGASKFNYMTLMMADKHVHTHIFPRYEDKTYDVFWPGLVDLNASLTVSEKKSLEIVDNIGRFLNED